VDTGGPVSSRPHRPSIGERAARRERVERGGADRYSSLMRAMRAGQEMPWQRRRQRTISLEWHPIAWALVRALVVVVIAYGAIVVGFNAWRDSRVETWAGPDATVTSGQRLADCPQVNDLHDDSFPTWIRFQGSVYGLTDTIRPYGFTSNDEYPDTGYRLGSLRLHRIANTPDGVAGDSVLIKIDTSAVGQVFGRLPDCR
jgi:hypothetical protein